MENEIKSPYNAIDSASATKISALPIIDVYKRQVCYYPEKISFPITGHESALFIEDEKIYFESWVEEGWNDKNDCATDNRSEERRVGKECHRRGRAF